MIGKGCSEPTKKNMEQKNVIYAEVEEEKLKTEI